MLARRSNFLETSVGLIMVKYARVNVTSYHIVYIVVIWFVLKILCKLVF